MTVTAVTHPGPRVAIWSAPAVRPGVRVAYEPVLDVARGTVAGYRAVSRSEAPEHRASLVTAALGALATLPPNTFLSVPLAPEDLDDPAVMEAFRAQPTLAPLFLDLAEPRPGTEDRVGQQLEELKAAGALVALGGADGAQPTLRSITRLRPAVIRLGRAWVSGVDVSATKRSTIELTGQLASQLDAWILAEDVSTPGELRALAELGVPLGHGPLIGSPREAWTEVDPVAQRVLPTAPRAIHPSSDGVLRSLVQQAYTTTDHAAAATVLPESTGFEVVVVVDDGGRPVSLLERDHAGRWEAIEPLVVNVDTSVPDVVERALARPRVSRFSPVAAIDAAGRLLGVVRVERLVTHLVDVAR